MDERAPLVRDVIEQAIAREQMRNPAATPGCLADQVLLALGMARLVVGCAVPHEGKIT